MELLSGRRHRRDGEIQEHAHPDWRVDDEQITDVALRAGCAMCSRRWIYELAASERKTGLYGPNVETTRLVRDERGWFRLTG